MAAMVANTMTKGSSGGAWLNYENQVVGLNSFIYLDRPYVMFSPLFEENMMTVFDVVRTGGSNSRIAINCNVS
jgi:hypothetical protein